MIVLENLRVIIMKANINHPGLPDCGSNRRLLVEKNREQTESAQMFIEHTVRKEHRLISINIKPFNFKTFVAPIVIMF